VRQNWELSQGAWTQLHQTWPKHRAIIAALHFCFRFLISCCIFKRVRLSEWCFKRRYISHHFWPPVNIRGGVTDISLPIVEALPTAKPPKYIWGAVLCVAADHGGLIKKRKKALKSLWVKLKAFPTDVGRLSESWWWLRNASISCISLVTYSRLLGNASDGSECSVVSLALLLLLAMGGDSSTRRHSHRLGSSLTRQLDGRARHRLGRLLDPSTWCFCCATWARQSSDSHEPLIICTRSPVAWKYWKCQEWGIWQLSGTVRSG